MAESSIFYKDPDSGIFYTFKYSEVDTMLKTRANPITGAPLDEQFLHQLENLELPDPPLLNQKEINDFLASTEELKDSMSETKSIDLPMVPTLPPIPKRKPKKRRPSFVYAKQKMVLMEVEKQDDIGPSKRKINNIINEIMECITADRPKTTAHYAHNVQEWVICYSVHMLQDNNPSIAVRLFNAIKRLLVHDYETVAYTNMMFKTIFKRYCDHYLKVRKMAKIADVVFDPVLWLDENRYDHNFPIPFVLCSSILERLRTIRNELDVPLRLVVKSGKLKKWNHAQQKDHDKHEDFDCVILSPLIVCLTNEHIFVNVERDCCHHNCEDPGMMIFNSPYVNATFDFEEDEEVTSKHTVEKA